LRVMISNPSMPVWPLCMSVICMLMPLILA
jgi:hypothetical protein